MDLQTVTRSDDRCVDLATLKANRRIRHAAEDTLLATYIDAAEEFAESRLNRAIMPTQFKLGLSRVLPTFQLPRPPFVEFVSLKYTFTDGDEVTVDTSALSVRYVEMLPTFTIPDLTAGAGTMEIVYNAGWVDADAVPSVIKRAVILLASHWDVSREAVFMDKRIMDVEKKIPFGFDALIGSLRVPNADGDFNGGY